MTQLIQARDGSFYGSTESGGLNGQGTGGFGTIFHVASNNPLTMLTWFNGSNPSGFHPNGVIQGADGDFYGTTVEGGQYYDPSPGGGSFGTIFKITGNGALTYLVSFAGTNGAEPQDALLQASDGNFYGTTATGGSYQNGTIFKMTPACFLTTLIHFDGTNGSTPFDSLIQGSDGFLYGSTIGGGLGYGTLFRMTTNGNLTTLVAWDGTNGGSYSNFSTSYKGGHLIEASDGNFYGITYGAYTNGAIFRMTRNGQVSVIFSFNSDSFWDNSTGRYPTGIVEGSDGNLYGMTARGPDFYGVGAVFRLVMPKILRFQQSGKNFIVSWPTNYTTLRLQTSTNLNSTNWSDYSPVCIVGTNYIITNSISENRFFRLKK